ncbi:MAG: hypothetical protein N2Z80_03225 [Hydrogenothermaceae bacterium]|nr:hypothetical protein [Hydrogenothermaceae bacterium]
MEALQKFQNLLKELFQFEASDLDFGIYRILNYKRKQIEKFIEEELKNKVDEVFAKYEKEEHKSVDEELEKVKNEIIEHLGNNTFMPTGKIVEDFKNTPLAKKFLEIKARKEEIEQLKHIKSQVFNDLYNFFSRYYEEGDFIPQYRYSIKGHKYAIPYNGEELKLYWANRDQYYIKTGILFRDYAFKAGDYRVIFRTVEAKEELNSNKETKGRFFVLDDQNPVEFIENEKVVIVCFQYRELTEEEVKYYGVKGGSNNSKQEKINEENHEGILSKIENLSLKGLLSKEYKNGKSLLLYQLNRFTAKNTKDYFIHKNLKSF